MSDQYACSLCGIVNDSVELFYPDDVANTHPVRYCIQHQKQAFHFFVDTLLLGVYMDGTPTEESARKIWERVVTLAKKNRITADYAQKLLLARTKRMGKKTADILKSPLDAKEENNA